MEPFENIEPEQQELEAQQPEIPETLVQPEPPQQPESEPAQAPESGYYHGVGVGQKEMPFASSPYVTYHPYEPYQSPVQPTAPAPEEKPEKPKKHTGKKILWALVALIAAAALVVTTSGLTAAISGFFWKNEYNTMKQYLEEKNTALQTQLDELQKKVNGYGGTLESQPDTLTAREIYQQNLQSVVALTCITSVDSDGSYATSAGTGFVMTAEGHIVTNYHVVEGAKSIVVTMADGTEYSAQPIGGDATNDVALIKVEAADLRPVVLGSSSDLQVGDQVVAIGNALGELTSSLTVGYISGMDRNVTTDGSIINMLQTDVAINSGNSGGPLFNAKGEVIGITTAKYSGTTSSGASIEGISFAIPIDDVIGLLEDLRTYGYIRSAYLGIYAGDVNPDMADYYGIPMGAYVSEVMSGNCAERAGIQAKDIIVELGGYEVTCMNDLRRALRKFEAGDTVTVKLWRSGQEIIVQVTLDEAPQS